MSDMTMDSALAFAPELQDFLKALAGDTRLRILMLFMDGRERTVGEVASAAKIGQSTASEHLSVLRRTGILTAHREGKEVYYTPNGAVIVARVRELQELLERTCGPF